MCELLIGPVGRLELARGTCRGNDLDRSTFGQRQQKRLRTTAKHKKNKNQSYTLHERSHEHLTLELSGGLKFRS